MNRIAIANILQETGYHLIYKEKAWPKIVEGLPSGKGKY